MSLALPYLESHAEHPSNDPIEDTHTIVTGDDYVYVGVCELLRRCLIYPSTPGAPVDMCDVSDY